MLYLKVDVELNEEKCSSCEHKFSCWSSKSRELAAQEFQIDCSVSEGSRFDAVFDITDLCMQIDPKCLLGNSGCVYGTEMGFCNLIVDKCSVGFVDDKTKIEVEGFIC